MFLKTAPFQIYLATSSQNLPSSYKILRNGFSNNFLFLPIIRNFYLYFVYLQDPLPYLQNFRNPCWIEKLPDVAHPYSVRPHKFEMMGFQESRLRVQSQFPQRKADGKPYRMRCLPYYYIIGPQKSGTTDLYNSLIKHPGVIQGMAKEPHWWPRSRQG